MLQLLPCLDALGRSGHAEADIKLSDRSYNCQCIHVGPGQIADKAAINLDLVERKLAQIAQRGITGPKVVEGNADAKVMYPA